MNAITKEQNTDRQLLRLAAQRQLYAKAKNILGWHVFLSGPLAVALAFGILAFPQYKAHVALWGLIVTLCDLVWFTPWQKKIRASAAGIQELFDCDVLNLPWDELKVGKRPDPELVKGQAKKYEKKSKTMPKLTNWYSPKVASLPLHIARIVCQRSNCWWDSEQRRLYANVVITIVAIVIVTLTFASLLGGFSAEDLVLTAVVPLLPVVFLGLRQLVEQRDAAVRLDQLKDHAMKLWSDSLDGASDVEVSARSRGLQSEIYECRKRNPPIFDFLFKYLRERFETQMHHGTEELVTDAKKRLGLD
jgi:SMODS-associating 4TM effector domain